MNSENSETSDPHRLLLNLADKTDLRRTDKYITLSNCSIYYTCIIYLLYIYYLLFINRSIYYTMSCKNNKFKIAAPTGNKEFELPDGSYSISYIQDYSRMGKRHLILQQENT